jgi:hypothetical protein
MVGKIALLVVALILLSATVTVAGSRVLELDSNPSPSDIVLSEANVPVFTSTSVWPGTIEDQIGRDNLNF